MAPDYQTSLRQTTLRDPISEHSIDIDVTGVISPLEKALGNRQHSDMTAFGIKTEEKGMPMLMEVTYPKDHTNSHLSPQIKDLNGEAVRYIRLSQEDENKAITRWRMRVLTGPNQGTIYEWHRHYKLPSKQVEKK